MGGSKLHMRVQEDVVGRLSDRMVHQELTPELLRDGSTHGIVTKERIEEAAKRFERSYNAIAVVRKSELPYSKEPGYTVTAIAARDAHIDEISRGMQSLLHWALEDEHLGEFKQRD